MKLNRTFSLLAITALLSSSPMAQAQTGNAGTTEHPLIDRSIFFGNPRISGGKLSPDGQWISFLKEYNGIMNIWVKKFDEPFDKAKPLTDSKRPLYGYFWTEDGKYILYVKDKDGDENNNIWCIDPLATAPEGKVPESRNLTPLKDVNAGMEMVSKKDKDLLYVSINDRDKAWHDLYKLRISTGKLERVYENKDRVTGYSFDWNEKIRFMYKTDEKGTTIIYRVDEGNKLSPVYETSVSEMAYVAGWTPDNAKCYLVTNKGNLDKSALFLMDPKDGSLSKVESDPQNKVDFGGLMIDENTHKIIGTIYTYDKTKFYWQDKKWEEMYNYLKGKFPGREISFTSMTEDYSKFLVATGGDKYAPEVYFYNTANKQLIHQYTPKPQLKEVESRLAPMQPITYKSSDGLEIPAYLTIPAGTSVKNLPAVVLVHGGPKGPRDAWGYDAQAQFLASRGYAVLQPNFRASGGYGKKFLNAGDKQWGKLMQDDITWGVKYLVDKGIVDKNKVAIMGGSYGGYATLAGLAFTPDLYTCGVDIVGPSNIFTLLESVPAYWESGRAGLYAMVGDPNTEEGKKSIKEASPLFSADKIIKPLLIIQGANDPRVKQAEADQIAIALRDKGKKVSYLLAKDEGHGFAKPLNRMAMFAEIEKFLHETLGGPYQQDMPADVAAKLEELRVDVSKVAYTPKAAVATATALPAISNSFKEGTEQFNVAIAVQGQNIAMEMTRTTTKSGDNWVIKDVSSSPMGTFSDELVVNSRFEPVSRTMEQMGQAVKMQFAAGKATTEMQGKTTEIALDGATVVEGPGCDVIFGGLPLAPGYTFTFVNPDMTSMKAQQATLSCLGDEQWNGTACTKIETVNSDNAAAKTTYWINKQTKKADKIVAVIPSMGNALMTITRK